MMGVVHTPQALSSIKPEITIYDMDNESEGRVFNQDTFHRTEKRTMKRKVIFLVHGYLGNSRRPWMMEMKSALLKYDNQSTILVVGWGNHIGYGAKAPTLGRAVANIPVVGEWLANYASMIARDCPGASLHGIGFSLGAHVLGVAGRLSQAFDRITGLDPSGPSSTSDWLMRRKDRDELNDGLCSTDAKTMVDVIHTDGRSTLGAGTLRPMGTIDFYPNGGKHQPKTRSPVASHKRAPALFTWSILNPDAFKTDHVLYEKSTPEEPLWIKSSTPVEMGFHCKPPEQCGQKFFIATNGEEPWV